jgi:hypothetical protein
MRGAHVRRRIALVEAHTMHALFMCVYTHTLYNIAHLLAFPFPEANAAQQSLFLALDAGHALEAAFWFRKLMSTTIII